LLKINPANASALYWRGRAKQANGDQKGGDADITAARKIDPDIGK
jgi:hypothetical protein